MGSRSDALIAFEKWEAMSGRLVDRLEFQHLFEGLFRQWTGRAFDDCLLHLSDRARKSIEACTMEFYLSQRPIDDMLQEFTAQPNQDLSYPQLMYLLALGLTKSSICEFSDSAPGAGVLLQDLI